jgi:non-ribosomal peptide synthase protein (TIGR01720 family)
LLKEVPRAYQTNINEVLLVTLFQAVTNWTGTSSLRLDLEGHGREAIFDDVDLLGTVGWFTTMFPVVLHREGPSNLDQLLKSIKEQLRRIPNRGLGYGLLRYLRNETRQTLQALPQAELSFRYRGQFDNMLSSTSPFALTNESCGPTRSLLGQRQYLLELNGHISAGQLHLQWLYSHNVHNPDTIEQLARNCMATLRQIIAHCQSPDAGGYTPSDFPEANLNQEELDNLLAEISES